MIAEGKDVIREAWWVPAIPGMAIAATVLGLSLLGDGLRDVLDPAPADWPGGCRLRARCPDERRIAGAGLDVFEHEPHVPEALRALDNVVLMPHRGGGTLETWADVTDSVKESLSAFFEGRPVPHRLD